VNSFPLIQSFDEISSGNISSYGGKNTALAFLQKNAKTIGYEVADGFALSSLLFWQFLIDNRLELPIKRTLSKLSTTDYVNLEPVAKELRSLIRNGKFSDEINDNIAQYYDDLCKKNGRLVAVAVRSSATTEDSPGASFAGQHDSFLNVRGIDDLLKAIKNCYASLYNARAIKYRIDKGFKHEDVSISVGIQTMVRSDLGASGIIFTIDPDSGFNDVLVIQSTYGLGEGIVQGLSNPDEHIMFKKAIAKNGSFPLISAKIGLKEVSVVYRKNHNGTLIAKTQSEKRAQFVLLNNEIQKLSSWAIAIEKYLGMPMDIEWAKDGETNRFFILQARPETIHAQKKRNVIETYEITENGRTISSGKAVGRGVQSGEVCILNKLSDVPNFKPGQILVTKNTNPDWEPILKKASAIITERGGRTSHAAIVARELGVIAIVGVKNALNLFENGQEITVDNSSGDIGFVYDGISKWKVRERIVEDSMVSKTKPMLILSNPNQAFQHAFYPSKGVGLLRMEFLINSEIGIHPLALIHFNELISKKAKKQVVDLTRFFPDKKAFYISKLTEGISKIASAFYSHPVIVRFSDFKSNEYKMLIGGEQFEQNEANPMLGFRGASRYLDPVFSEAFKLECEAIRRVRDDLGFKNVHVMIPFCRSVQEAHDVVELLKLSGLKSGQNGLELYLMLEVPSNIILFEQFAEYFDGFSIGSNDLTQLTLGIDRDTSTISYLFNENDPAVVASVAKVVRLAKKLQKKIGICGQAPSDSSAFTEFLIEAGIDSISFTPDAFFKGLEAIEKAEAKQKTLC
jgi:pyruvate,water dikinase